MRARGAVGWAVVVAWAGLTALQVSYVTRYGRNAPTCEEWLDVPALFGETSRAEWLTARLNEHRYLLGRVVHLAAFEAAGRDFRAGRYVDVALLAATALVLARLAARVRGRPHAADLAFPLLFLGPSHHENLLLGFQVYFCLNVLLAAGVLRLAADADARPPARTGLLAGALLVPFALGGGVGLLFVPPVAAWVGFLAVRTWRTGRSRAAVAGMAGFVSLALAAVGFWLWDVARHPAGNRTPSDPLTNLRVAVEFLAMGYGTPAIDGWPASGVVAAAGWLAAAGGLAWVAARRPSQRAVAAGWLAVLAAVLGMGAGVGRWREEAFASRYVSLAALVPAVGLLTLARFGPAAGRLGAAAGVGLAGVLGACCVLARPAAKDVGTFHRVRFDAIRADAAAGLPLPFLTDRHQPFPNPDVEASLRVLRDHGRPPSAGSPDAPPFQVVPVSWTEAPLPPGPHDAAALGRPRAWLADFGEARPLVGVRVRVRYPRTGLRVPLQLVWADAAGRWRESSAAPWLAPGTWDLRFPVGGPASRVWFRSPDAAEPVELERGELLVPPP